MPTLRIGHDPAADIGTITVDDAIKGGITKVSRSVYRADTAGRLPAIDGVEGASIKDVADRIMEKTRAGEVYVKVDV